MLPPEELVGRDAELTEIRQFLDGLALGPAAIIIEGEAGIGKTALWLAALREASKRRFRILSTQPVEAETKLSFSGLGDLFGDVEPEILDALPNPQRRAVSVALLREDPRSARVDPRTLGVAVLGMLRALANGSSLIVAVDDLQWMDGPSRRALAFAVRRLGAEKIGLLLTLRREGVDDPLALAKTISAARIRRIPIEGLSVGALRRVLTQRIGMNLSRPALSKIHTLSGGNPMFALEITQEILRRRQEVDVEAPLLVPDNLRALVRGGLDRLDEPARHALLVVSAMSDPSVQMVESVLGRRGQAGLRTAVERGAIVEDRGRLSPSHPLLGSVAYQEAPPDQRRSLHRRLAQFVTDPEGRARHLALAASRSDAEVAVALDEASRLARARGAPDTAAELIQRAAELTPGRDGPSLWRRTTQAAEYWFSAGESARARSTLERLADVVPAGRARAWVLWRLGRIRYMTDSFPAAAALFREGLDEARDDIALSGRLEQALSFASMVGGDLASAMEHARAALRTAEELNDPALLPVALALVAALDFLMGKGLDRAAFDRSIELEGSVDDDLPMEWRPSYAYASILTYADELDEARATFRRLHRQATEQGDEGSIPTLLFPMSRLECLAGDWTLADRYAAVGLQAARESGQDQMTAQALYSRAEVDAHMGRIEEAREAVEEGLGIARQVGAVAPMIQLTSVLGFVGLSVGDPEETHRHLGPMAEMLRQVGVAEPGVVRFLPDEIEALIALGRRDEAADFIERLEERGRTLGRVSALASAGRCRGYLLNATGDLEGARRAFDDALRMHDRLPIPFERGRTLLARGQVERRAKRWGDARASLTAALEIFERLGALRWAERARDELARVGGRAPTPVGLTATERAIAQHVAEGLSNRAVADALFLSPRTVEGTLTKIYRKLGITSRAQLAARLAARPKATPRD